MSSPPSPTGDAGARGGTGRSVDDNPLRDPVVRRLAVVVVLGAIMSVLDTTIVNVAIETLSRDFHSSVSTIQWVTTGYLLALAVVIPMSGWLMERFGAKEMWILSLILFTGGSALCSVSWSANSLIAFRILQGLGGGMIMPIGQSILARAAGPARMGRVMSIIGIPTLIAPVLGPVLGGIIVDDLTWRWIFLVNVPIGVVALILSLRLLESGQRQDAGPFDLLGLLLLSPGLALVVYGLSEAGGGSGFGSPTVIGCLAGGLVLCAAFVRHAWRATRPLLDVRLFADRGFSVSNVTTFLFGASLYGAMFLLPLYYQVVRGESALVAGLLMAPQGIGAMLTMSSGGRLTDRLGARTVVPIGMAVFALGTLAYTQLGTGTSYAWLAVTLFIRGAGMGWTMMPAISATYLNLRHEDVPRATTVVNIMLRVGGSFGTALVAVVLQRQIASRLPRLATILSSPPAVGHALTGAVGIRLADSFGVAFWFVTIVSVAGVAAALLLPRRRAAAEGAEVADPLPVAME